MLFQVYSKVIKLYIYVCVCVYTFPGFPGGSEVKNLPATVGETGLIPESGRPHSQRTLAGYSPWGHKRSGHDLETKQQHIYFFRFSFPYRLLQNTEYIVFAMYSMFLLVIYFIYISVYMLILTS